MAAKLLSSTYLWAAIGGAWNGELPCHCCITVWHHQDMCTCDVTWRHEGGGGAERRSTDWTMSARLRKNSSEFAFSKEMLFLYVLVVDSLLQVFPGAVSAVAAAAGVKPNISLQQQLYQQRLQVRNHGNLTSLFVFASNVINGFHGNKWWCLHLTLAFSWLIQTELKRDREEWVTAHYAEHFTLQLIWELKQDRELNKWLNKSFCTLPGELMENLQ